MDFQFIFHLAASALLMKVTSACPGFTNLARLRAPMSPKSSRMSSYKWRKCDYGCNNFLIYLSDWRLEILNDDLCALKRGHTSTIAIKPEVWGLIQLQKRGREDYQEDKGLSNEGNLLPIVRGPSSLSSLCADLLEKRMSFSGCKLGFLLSIILDFQTSFYVILRIVTLVQFKTHSGKWLKTLQELILKTIFSASAADFILRQNKF